MTDQIADARPPTRAETLAEKWRLALYPHIGHDVFHELLADDTETGWDDVRGEVAALAKIVATLRSERDKWKQEAADLYHRNEILGTDAHYAEREVQALRARVQHLTEALTYVSAELRHMRLTHQLGPHTVRKVDSLIRHCEEKTTPKPASTEGR